jgi:hypothetical protein
VSAAASTTRRTSWSSSAPKSCRRSRCPSSSALAPASRSRLADAGLAHGGIEVFRRAAPPRGAGARARRAPAGPAGQAPRPAGQRRLRCRGQADACRARLRRELPASRSTQLARVKEGKGEFLFHEGVKAGAPTPSLLPGIVQASLDALPIPKRMRWGAGSAEFVRPVHWLLMMFGAGRADAKILDTESGKATRGHRFMRPRALLLPVRRRLRRHCANAAACSPTSPSAASASARRSWRARQKLGGRAVVDEELLDEVAAPGRMAGRGRGPLRGALPRSCRARCWSRRCRSTSATSRSRTVRARCSPCSSPSATSRVASRPRARRQRARGAPAAVGRRILL